MLRCRGIDWGGWQSIGWWTKQGKKLIAFVKIWSPKREGTNKVLQIKVFEKIGEGRNVSFDGEIEWIRGGGWWMHQLAIIWNSFAAQSSHQVCSAHLNIFPRSKGENLCRWKKFSIGNVAEVESRSCQVQRSFFLLILRRRRKTYRSWIQVLPSAKIQAASQPPGTRVPPGALWSLSLSCYCYCYCGAFFVVVIGVSVIIVLPLLLSLLSLFCYLYC